MWMRWAVASCSLVLLLSTAILYSYQSSTDPVYTRGLTRLDLTLENNSIDRRTVEEARNPSSERENSEGVVGSSVQDERPDEVVTVNEVTVVAANEVATSVVDDSSQNEAMTVEDVSRQNEASEIFQQEPVFQELLPNELDVFAEGPFKGAGLRGFVDKQGMIPPAYFTPWTSNIRAEGWEQWMHTYRNGNKVGHAPLPYPHCQVYVNHFYKFIWIKGHKVGSTSMRGPLGWLCDDQWRVPSDANYTYCSEGLFKDKKHSVKQIAKWWDEYFVFGIVRNPYTRFASAEEYIGSMVGGSCGKRPTFAQTCQDPYIHARWCRTKRCCFNGASVHHYRHFMDQASCLFTDTLLPAVDFIGEAENLDEDFDTIVDVINDGRDPSLPPLVSDLKKKNVHGRRLQSEDSYAHNLFKQNPDCLPSITRFYNKEFALLKYESLEHLD